MPPVEQDKVISGRQSGCSSYGTKVRDGFLWRAYEEESSESFTLLLVVPSQYRQQILQELRSRAMGGHLGTEKVHARQAEGASSGQIIGVMYGCS